MLAYKDNRIQKAFSDSAVRYDVLSGLQREVGEKLLESLKCPKACRNILDIGMGTGRLTNQLKFLFPQAHVWGMDFAGGMIDCAKQRYKAFHMVQADAARVPFKDNIFDLIVSNLAYQWIDALEDAFKQNYSVLKQQGSFFLTMFGRKTLEELFESLNDSFSCQTGEENGTGRLPIKRLPSREEVETALHRAGFKAVDVQTQIMKVHFADMLSLVRWLKDTGANAVKRDFFVGRDRLFQASDFYHRNYRDRKGIFASFEVIWGKAEK